MALHCSWIVVFRKSVHNISCNRCSSCFVSWKSIFLVRYMFPHIVLHNIWCSSCSFLPFPAALSSKGGTEGRAVSSFLCFCLYRSPAVDVSSYLPFLASRSSVGRTGRFSLVLLSFRSSVVDVVSFLPIPASRVPKGGRDEHADPSCVAFLIALRQQRSAAQTVSLKLNSLVIDTRIRLPVGSC